MDVSIVIVSYNNGYDLLWCLRSIIEQTKCINHEIIIIDNASKDDSILQARHEFPNVIVVQNRKNLGFAKACNQGWRMSTGRYVYFLNPDARLTNNVCLIASQFLDSRLDIGIIGTKTLNLDDSIQPSRRSFPNLMTSVTNRCSILSKFWPNNVFTRKYLRLDSDHTAPIEVDWVTGSSMFARRSTLDCIGGFDEDYFLYCEDVDICRRVANMGWKIWYLPYAAVYHRRGGSANSVKERSSAARHRGMWIYYKKHFRRNVLLDIFVFWGILIRRLSRYLC